MVKADFAKSLTHLGVATVLLTGITICVARGYQGFLALQDTPVSPPVNPASMNVPSTENETGKPASFPTARHAVSDGLLATGMTPTSSSQPREQRRSVQHAVWRQPPPARSAPAARRDPRSAYRSPLPASAWPGFQPGTPGGLQRPAYTPRTYGWPTAVRSGFGSSHRSRIGGKACMGFG